VRACVRASVRASVRVCVKEGHIANITHIVGISLCIASKISSTHVFIRTITIAAGGRKKNSWLIRSQILCLSTFFLINPSRIQFVGLSSLALKILNSLFLLNCRNWSSSSIIETGDNATCHFDEPQINFNYESVFVGRAVYFFHTCMN